MEYLVVKIYMEIFSSTKNIFARVYVAPYISVEKILISIFNGV